MITASLALCKQLHAVSGWTGTLLSWYCDEERDDTPVVNLSEPLKVVGGVGHHDHQYPAYDVGYLIGMLPAHRLIKRGNATYIALWFDQSNGRAYVLKKSPSPFVSRQTAGSMGRISQP